jgi:hypothetical protein
MHLLQNLSQISSDNMKSGRCEISGRFRSKTLSEWYCELQTGSKNKTIGGWQTCSKVYQPRYKLRSVLNWAFMQCRLVVCYRHFRTTYQFCLQGASSPIKHQKQITNLHCVESQKTKNLIYTVVEA